MLPSFLIATEQRRVDSAIGAVSSTTQNGERWVSANALGYLLSDSTLIPGRWLPNNRHILDTFRSNWRFAPLRSTDTPILLTRPEWSILDGYWGERAELVLDQGREWTRESFSATDAIEQSPGMLRQSTSSNDRGDPRRRPMAWDHEHCAICWQKISSSDESEAYVADSVWACIRCYQEYVEPRSLAFVQAV